MYPIQERNLPEPINQYMMALFNNIEKAMCIISLVPRSFTLLLYKSPNCMADGYKAYKHPEGRILISKLAHLRDGLRRLGDQLRGVSRDLFASSRLQPYRPHMRV